MYQVVDEATSRLNLNKAPGLVASSTTIAMRFPILQTTKLVVLGRMPTNMALLVLVQRMFARR